MLLTVITILNNLSFISLRVITNKLNTICVIDRLAVLMQIHESIHYYFITRAGKLLTKKNVESADGRH